MKKRIFAVLLTSILVLTGCNQKNNRDPSNNEKEAYALSSISLSGSYRTTFYQNETFSYEGLVVIAHYTNNSEHEVTNYTVSSPDMTTLGEKQVTVEYIEDSVSKDTKYTITVGSSISDAERSAAKLQVRQAFNDLDIDDYSEDRWNKIVDKLNEALRLIDEAVVKEDMDAAVTNVLAYFASCPKASEVTKGTWFDYHSADSNYQFDRDDENNLVITYDGYPGHWVYTGTKTNLHTDTTKNNILSITFRNDIEEGIQVCLQATNDGGDYKADTGIVNIAALETKTLELDYDVDVTKLYFFVDSCSVHERVGKVTILNTELKYENREPSTEFSPKTVSINKSMTTDDSGADTYYTLTDADHPLYISRIDALVIVHFNGNDDSHKYYGLHLYYNGSNHKSYSDSQGHSQEFKESGVAAGTNTLFNCEIDSASKLHSGVQIHMDISYQAAGLTFEVVSYTFYYSLWKSLETETVEINTDIYVNGSGKDVNSNYYTALAQYSSFTKKGKVRKMDVSFSTVNNASYGKSQIYVQGFDFTAFTSGNNNVLNIGKQMDTSKSGVVTDGIVTLYPVSTIDLTKDSAISFVCWWASATTITIKSVTLYTDNVNPPEAVEGLEAHSIDSGVVLNWNTCADATSYEIYINGEISQEVSSTYATISGLTNGTTYTFGVKSKNASGVSEMVTVSGTPVEGATYDTFIESLNTPLEEQIGEERITTMFESGCTYLSKANNERLKSVISKMQNGQETTVAFMGGSITVGETASLKDENNHAKGYAYYTYQWLKRNYDVQNKSSFVNGSICGTGSEIGIVRAQKDILNYNPDLIFIEFAANNGTTDYYETSYESLIRKCLSLESNPCIVLVFSGTYYTGGTENYMAPIGEYYGLPMFTMDKPLRAVCSVIDKARTDEIFAGFSDDGTHPNDNGHQLYAKLLCYFLRNLINKETDTAAEKKTAPSASGMDKFEDLVAIDNTNATGVVTSLGSFVAANTGTPSTRDQSDVTAFQQGWKKTDTTVNEPMTIEVNAKNFIIIYEAGNASVAGDPTGNIVVTYTNKNDASDTGTLTWDVSKTIKQSTSGSTAITDQSSSGWENPVGVLIFDKNTAADYTITIKMENASDICTIMALGYTA